MDKDEQLLVSMKLAGHGSKEFAAMLKLLARSVRHILKCFQDHLAQLVTDD